MWICVPAGLMLYTVLSPQIPKQLQFVGEAIYLLSNGMLLLGSYFLFTNWSKTGRAGWLLFVMTLYLVTLPAASRSGQMEPLLMPALMIVCGYVVARQTLPWLALMIGAPVAIYFILPFTAFYKLSKTDTSSVDYRIRIASEAFVNASYQSRLELALERTLVRFSGMPFPATYLQYYPSAYPFEHGRSFLLEASGVVPRVIWRDKPMEYELNTYPIKVGLIGRADTSTSMIFDGISEYYLNFDDRGVFLLSIVNGWYFALLYGWLVRKGQYLIGCAIYVALMAGNWDCFGVVNIASAHIRIVPLWILVYYLMSHRKHGHVR
jgi:hypothetical protein